LNQLLGQPAFPTDVSLTLPLRHETRLRLSQPLFRPEIYFGNRLADHGVRGAELTLAVYRRDLVATVKATYWAHARAALLDELLGRTRPLIEENLRVSELLVAQGKSTDEVVLRARADLAELDQRRREAARARGDAARYLAFLAGASLDDPPPVPPAAVQAAPALPPLAELESRALSRREELRLAELSADVARTEASLARSAYLPTLGVALDYGFQGNDIDFSSDRDSFAASVVLEWNLFRGLRDRNRAKVGEIAHAQALSRRAEVERQIRLDVRRAWHEAATAEQAITSSAARVESVRAAYEIVARRYAAGTAPQIELLQATTELTRAETDQILAFTEYQTRLALLERAAAIAELHQEKRP
jgi:outer membrane protein TolC